MNLISQAAIRSAAVTVLVIIIGGVVCEKKSRRVTTPRLHALPIWYYADE